MASIKTRKILGSLMSKGFVLSESDHSILTLYVNDKKMPIYTKISHGKSEYGDNLINKVKNQLKLDSRQQLEDLINCPMSYEEYVGLLVKNNYIKIPVAPEISVKVGK